MWVLHLHGLRKISASWESGTVISRTTVSMVIPFRTAGSLVHQCCKLTNGKKVCVQSVWAAADNFFEWVIRKITNTQGLLFPPVHISASNRIFGLQHFCKIKLSSRGRDRDRESAWKIKFTSFMARTQYDTDIGYSWKFWTATKRLWCVDKKPASSISESSAPERWAPYLPQSTAKRKSFGKMQKPSFKIWFKRAFVRMGLSCWAFLSELEFVTGCQALEMRLLYGQSSKADGSIPFPYLRSTQKQKKGNSRRSQPPDWTVKEFNDGLTSCK